MAAEEGAFPKAVIVRKVIAFTFRAWAETPIVAGCCALAMLLATLTEVVVPLYASRMIDAVAADSATAAWTAFATIAVLGVMLVTLRYAGRSAIVPLTLHMMCRIGQEGFTHVQSLSTDWHADNFSGSTVRRITRGMWAIDTLNDVLLLSLLPSITILVGTVTLLAATSPLLGAVMGVGAVAYVTFTVGLATQVMPPIARLSNRWDTRMTGLLSDAIGTNAVVKAFGGEPREEALFGQVIAKWRKRTGRTWNAFTLTSTGQLALLWITRLVLTAAVLWLWAGSRASAGDVAYVVTSYLVLNGYLRDVGFYVYQLQRSVNEMEELVELTEEQPAVADCADAQPLVAATGGIRYEDVTFRYPTQERVLFEGLSITVPAGQRVGLVGPSGSGKSSFIKLLQRLYDVDEGRVLVDGQDIAHVAQRSLRRQIAIVPQEPLLFHRSIADNIAYGRSGASRTEIEAAARLANAHDFINRFSKGYRTQVGERGVKLSGGERQRVAIARAFLVDAPIMIFDEATSSLDAETEAAIREAMERLMVGRTALVIAHRLSTVRTLDRILVFSDGAIVEDGSHDQLISAQGGHYRRLFERQAGEALPGIVA